jgi:hypothetical protein
MLSFELMTPVSYVAEAVTIQHLGRGLLRASSGWLHPPHWFDDHHNGHGLLDACPESLCVKSWSAKVAVPLDIMCPEKFVDNTAFRPAVANPWIATYPTY